MESLEHHYPAHLNVPLRTIMKLMNFVIIASGITMALTFFFVVVARYGFGADLFAYEEWLLVIAIWLFFLASAVATHNRAHVKADMLGFMIKNPKLLYWRGVLVEAIELIITLVIVYWGCLMIKESIDAYPNWQRTVALHIPFLVPRLGILIGFVMMAVYSALHLYVLLCRRDQALNSAKAD
ncbi:TRAP transporter small permease [Halomonas sp. CS7]|uniref:TRAP transporter small permease protein n=1 Tax=Halomonas pelophila TaxID=3151122 RepID=A0ABV1N9Z5_9GAMM